MVNRPRATQATRFEKELTELLPYCKDMRTMLKSVYPGRPKEWEKAARGVRDTVEDDLLKELQSSKQTDRELALRFAARAAGLTAKLSVSTLIRFSQRCKDLIAQSSST